MKQSFFLTLLALLIMGCKTTLSDQEIAEVKSIDIIFEDYYKFKDRINPIEASKAGNYEYNNSISDYISDDYQKDLIENTEFRIKWPRGQLGSLPADSEQFMMIEDLYKTVDKLSEHIESMALNKINIEFLTKQLEKALEDIEELKDSNREIHYKNGGTH